jgi:hypothetical protein
VAVHYPDLEAMVDAAIMVEDKNKAARESRKRRMMNQGGPSGHRSRSMPPSKAAPPPQRFTSQAPRPNNPSVSTPATARQEETSLEATATLSTPPTAVRVVDATLVVSLDTSLRSAL